ncbi:MAG: protoporphyrinogen oxidase, partial [Calditrichaeota bacterium]
MTDTKYDVAIIGGGISGLSALHYVKRDFPHLSVKLFESDNRLGGTIGTDHINGYSFDWGPNGFLDREPLTLELCEQLGLNSELERANNKVTNRFILRKNKLRSVPMSPPAFLTSDILPISAKLRVMMEPFAKKRPEGIDESIYDFVQRRIGTSAADFLVQPMVSGVYGGIAKELSLKSCFPVMREMEDEYGSLFKAMIAKAKAAKAKGKKSGSPSGPGGWLTSFNGGLYRIIEQFYDRYKPDISCNKKAASISKEDAVYSIEFGDGSKIETQYVILATPSYVAADITLSLSDKLSNSLGAIPYAPISVICLGYNRQQVSHDLEGFGFLVPQKENRKILGSIWTSSIFENRAPDDKVQFRTMVGGDGDHDSIKLTDDELLARVIKDMNDIVGLTGEPD